MEQFLRLSQSLSIGARFRLAHKGLANLSVHNYYNRLQVVFKENSDLPSDVDSTRVTFNSLFINGLNKNLSLLVMRSRMGWGTMATLDLVNLANKLASTLDEPPKSKIAKISNSWSL